MRAEERKHLKIGPQTGLLLLVITNIIATSFSIFISYARRMLPCLMVGSPMLKTISLHQLIAGLRRVRGFEKVEVMIVPLMICAERNAQRADRTAQ